MKAILVLIVLFLIIWLVIGERRYGSDVRINELTIGSTLNQGR